MSAAEEWREEGREEEARALVLRLVRRRFGEPDRAQRERIERADRPTLERWHDDILQAESIEALLRG